MPHLTPFPTPPDAAGRIDSRPLVLCVSGLDPSGGAGLHADIEAIAALGGHALGVISALTVQDTRDVLRVVAVEAGLLREQLEALLSDCRPAAVKLGLLGSAEQVPVIVKALDRLAVPVVCDPVLRAGGGTELASAELVQALHSQLLPRVTVLTPNAAEARRLAPEGAGLDACGEQLLVAGCSHVLITGGDEPGTEVVNRAYTRGCAARRYVWPRLPGPFHGAGCTLAAAIAALLARGEPIEQALERAQAYTHRTLAQASRIGSGRPIPRRIGAS